MLVAGEDAQQVASQIPGEPRKFRQVVDLDFAMRHITMLPIRRKVVVCRKAEVLEFTPLQPAAQMIAFGSAEIQNGNVRTLGRKHNALEAEIGSFVDELVKRQAGLSPGAGIADGMQHGWEFHTD